MAALLIENVFAEMESLIGGIRAGEMASNGSDGANFDWNPCNRFDANLYLPGPNADLFLLQESPTDLEVQNNGGLLENHLDLEIRVAFKYADPPENPIRQAQIDLFKCLDDLKRVFGREHSLGDSGAFDILRSAPSRIEYAQSGDMPGRLISPWRVTYSQHRDNPDLRG